MPIGFVRSWYVVLKSVSKTQSQVAQDIRWNDSSARKVRVVIRTNEKDCRHWDNELLGSKSTLAKSYRTFCDKIGLKQIGLEHEEHTLTINDLSA